MSPPFLKGCMDLRHSIQVFKDMVYTMGMDSLSWNGTLKTVSVDLRKNRAVLSFFQLAPNQKWKMLLPLFAGSIRPGVGVKSTPGWKITLITPFQFPALS